MVAYFGRCLIVISKDKITSYHIWKMFLQSFSHELGGEWRQRRLQHEDMQRAKSKSMWQSPLLWGGFQVDSRPRFMKKRCISYYYFDATGLFLPKDQTVWVPERVNNTVPIQNVVENFEQFLSRLIWHNLNINLCKLYICVSQADVTDQANNA
jgi:hypothetical protein